ncbi:MAG: SOS response-associated peptidase [Phycisphaeraceae bacterium]|nr:SOS response-associated peptidase [Phycisphaeraceae bacterium]
MCGRFSQTRSTEQLADRFVVPAASFDWTPRYNLAPGQSVPTIIRAGDRRSWKRLQWGLVPPWAQDRSIGHRLINARSETVDQKPSFRKALKKRRCLVPADGFYEWKKQAGRTKVPVYLTLKDGSPFAFAGLWETWSDPDHPQSLETFTICTTAPNERVRPIHDRMPAILRPEDEATWLDPGIESPDRLKSLLKPYPADAMVARRVDRYVNNPAHEGPECIREAPDPPPQTLFGADGL